MLKPSERTPLLANRLAELFTELDCRMAYSMSFTAATTL
nr:hypothetical protein [Cohnella faecalis]